jgi:hypothetical protein
MSRGYARGNALADADRGWFVGQFVASEHGLRRRDDVELKWQRHPRGETRAGSWISYRTATTIPILIEGEILIRIRVGNTIDEVRLHEAGDYVILPPMVVHTWEALSECVVLTVRTPSVADDALVRYETS